MSANIQSKGYRVTLSLLSGEKESGLLVRFSPLKRRFALQTDLGHMLYFDMPEIVYIGFHTPLSDREEKQESNKTKSLVVHTLTNEVFRVRIEEESGDEGFFAYPEDEQTPFKQMFFYNHGVRLLEQPRHLGEILVDGMTLPEHKIKEALEAQEELKRKPLGGILVEQNKVAPADIERALATQRKKRKQIGEILIEAELIRESDLQFALEAQKKNRNMKIGEILIKMGVVTEEEVTSSLARKFNLPFVDLDEYDIKFSAVEEIDSNILLEHQILPINSDEYTLTIARSDPMDIEAFDNIRFQTKKRIVEVLATPTQVKKYLDREISELVDENNEFLWIERLSQEEKEEEENELTEVQAAEASPIVRLVNKLLVNAIQKQASDIHILPQSKKLLVLYRINGDLLQEMILEKWLQRRVVSRIKLLSGMNIADHRVTQDGRMLIYYKGKHVELRVSCIPNASGESLVMRVLNKEMAADLQALGLREEDRRALSTMSQKPFGLILATGPTGSGKSTTLFSLLKQLIDRPLHIITIEDPVESEIEGTNQIQVNNKVGLTFANILRNVLRHDPDVIMVGEMRDLETASIGVEAALTGHLMLSTLHTNSAVDTVLRLQDIGIPSYLLAPALRGIISQNLLKRLCRKCRQPLTDESHEVYEILREFGLNKPRALYEAKGCERCNGTGYDGRVMAYELLVVDDRVRDAIHHGMVGQELQKLAEREGMIPKARHALELAEQGIISHEDLVKMLI